MRGSWIGYAMLTYAAVYTAVRAGDYVTHPSGYNPLFQAKYLAMLPLVLAHGLAGITALAVGPFQLVGQGGRAHRWWGRVYALAVLVGSVTGLEMARHAFGGLPSQIGFCAMSTLWLVTLAFGVAAARRRRFAEHRRWMVRNYALTFAALLLRGYLNTGKLLGLDYQTIYPYITWLSWVPTLALTELVLRWRGGRPRHDAAMPGVPQDVSGGGAVPDLR